MTASELAKLAEGILVLAGIAAVFWAVFRNKTTKDIIENQNTLINTLKGQVDAVREENKELRTLHVDNEKAISKLQGQVDVYKELPLSQLATSMNTLADTQKKILELLEKQ